MLGIPSIPPIPQKKDSASLYPEGEKADPRRRLKLLIWVIILIVVVIVLFAPVWETKPVYSVAGKDIYKVSYNGMDDCTQYTIFLEDLGLGGFYFVEFNVQNFTSSRYWKLEPLETRSVSATSCFVHAEDFSYTVRPPEGGVPKSIVQILAGL